MTDTNSTPEFAANSEALTAATERRVEMKTAISRVERAAAAPSLKPAWRDDLVRELDELRIALDQHIAEVEGEEGLLAELTFDAPRLANRIDAVRREHPELCRQLDAAIDRVKATEEVADVRTAVLDSLVALARHRQKGADLVYEGYSIDIGGG
ncbi:MAG: hypothetical protein ACR2P0_13015 [Acidimicrobiales bacterium]